MTTTREGDRQDASGPAAVPGPGPRSILVVEDDTQLRGLLTELFEQEGYRLYHAADGEEGCRVARTRRPDLVITDVVMPVMDGVELIMALREEGVTAPIVAMSGGNRGFGASYLDVAEKLGAVAVLEKPVSNQVLLDTIAELTGGPNPPA